jgi:hypothetical protein
MSSPLVAHPLVIDPAQSYTFRSYFEMRYAPDDILGDFGCTLVKQRLELPRVEWNVTALKRSIERHLPYVNLTSEDARKQTLIGPILLELAAEVQVKLQVEYPVAADPQYLKGDLDYYLATQQGLLVVEAKNADLSRGFVQLAIELIGLHLWLSKREAQTLPATLIGCVTTGDLWQFGQYSHASAQVTQDLSTYRVPEDLETLTAILKGVLEA